MLCTQIVRLQEFPRAKLQGGPQDTLIIHSKQKQGLDAITRHNISFSSLGSAFDTNVPLCHLLLLFEYGDWENGHAPAARDSYGQGIFITAQLRLYVFDRPRGLWASQHKHRHLGSPTGYFKISAAATAPAELAKGPSAGHAVQTVPHHAPSTAVDIQVCSLTTRRTNVLRRQACGHINEYWQIFRRAKACLRIRSAAMPR